MKYDFTDDATSMVWTTSPISKQALKTIPFIELTGYQQSYSATIAAIGNWYNRFTNAGGQGVFKGLYLGDRTVEYKLPFLTEYHHNITQSWEENSGPLGEPVKEALSVAQTMAKALLPSAGIVYPKAYAGTQAAQYSITLNLINTFSPAGPEHIATSIKKNKAFLESLINFSLHDQNNALGVVPPLIYEVYVPGVRWSPAAVISGLTVNNKGTLNMNTGILTDVGENYIYPDVWEVTINITELINENRTIYNDAISGVAYSNYNGKIKTRAIQ